MRLDSIVLENFGCYARKEFEFRQQPLVLIFGANESGKTTALNGLRQAMFGFRPRTPYLTGGTMSAAVAARLQSGKRLEFTRRKGRPDTVTGQLGQNKLEAPHIQELLGNVDLDSYEHLFGFSQEELRLGQETLKSARLTEALAGGSLGGMHALEHLRTELASSLQDLYKPRGSTSQINVRLQKLKQLKQQLRDNELLPSAVEDLRRQLRHAESAGDTLREEYESLLRRQQAAERLLAALPQYVALKTTERQLEQLDLPHDLDAAFLANWTDMAGQRQGLQDNLAQERGQLELERLELNALAGETNWLAVEDEIEALGYQAADLPDLRRRKTSLEEQCQVRQRARDKLLQLLTWDSVPSGVHSFSISLPRRRELDSLGTQYQAASKELVAVTARLQAAEESLAASEASDTQQSVPDNLTELAALVSELAIAEGELAAQAKTLDKQQHEPHFVERCRRLRLLLAAEVDLDPEWPVPLPDQVTQNRRRIEAAEAHVAQQQAAVEEVRGKLQELRSRDHSAGEESTEEVLRQLDGLRQQRDAIVHQWLDELSEPLLAASLTVAQQQQRLQELQRIGLAVDELQTRLFEMADNLAEERQQQLRMNELQARLHELSQRETDSLAAVRQLRDAWQTRWSPVPVKQVSLDELQAWAEDFEKWCVESAQLQAVRRELHIARGAVRNLRERLLDTWPTRLKADMPLSVLQQQLHDWEAAKRQRVQEQQRRAASAEAVKTLRASFAELEGKQQLAEAAFREWLAGTPLQGLPGMEQWPVQEAGALLDAVESLLAEEETLARLQTELQQTESQLAEFQRRVERLAIELVSSAESSGQAQQAVAPAASPMESAPPPEQLASKWLEQLRGVREERTRRIQLTSNLEHRSQRVRELEANLKKIDAKLASLAASNPTLSATDIDALLTRARTAEQLRQQLGQYNAALEASCPDGDLGAFRERLATLDEATLRSELAEVGTRLSDVEKRRKAAYQELGSIQERLEQLAGNHQAQATRQQIQHERGELAELAEQWMVQRLASELLNRSIELFAAENEPDLIRYTRAFLSQLTGGRYTDVEHDQADKEQFSVRSSTGEACPPNRLSTGTREQLYLAIRLAFIKHHCQQHEPLPVVMDDCFVNFDDDRTRLALEVIANQGEAMQTILLSCHSRVTRILADIAPETLLIHLDRTLTTTVGDFVRQSAATTK